MSATPATPALPAPQAEAPALPLAARIEHINTLAARVAMEESRARAACTAAWQTGIILGHALCCLKHDVGHGEFGRLFKNNSKLATCGHFEISYRSARRYMTLYKEAESYSKRHNISMQGASFPAEADLPPHLTLSGALNYFRDTPPTPSPRPTATFVAPNTAGRIAPATPETTEQESIAAQETSATKELGALVQHLAEITQSGRLTLVAESGRTAATAILKNTLHHLAAIR